MLKHIICLCLLLFVTNLHSRNADITYRLFHTANIADLNEDSHFFKNLSELLTLSGEPTSLLINGDLIKNKFTETDSSRIARLLTLTEYLNMGKLIILSGERDWDDSGKDGLKQVKQLEKYIESFHNPKVDYAIEKGCPGPVELDLTDNVLLVLFNTQWWNHPFNKPGPQDADCKITTTDIFKEELEDILDENPDHTVLIAGHYPIFSLGEYGGDIPLIKHLFPLTDLRSDLYIPLPVMGSFYAAFRRNIGTSRDIINENFLEIHQILQETITHNSGIIYLSGHDRNLQILQKDDNYFINSGSPVSAQHAGSGADALYSEAQPGVIELIFYASGKVETKVHLYSEKKGFISQQSLTLYNARSKNEPIGNRPANTFNNIISISGKKAITAAGNEYTAGSIKRFFWGDHYRDTWTQKVSVPFLDLDSTFGGLTVYKKGGGRQTKSLKFKAANGQSYSFRSVDKDPTKALPYNLRETVARDILKDQTTTQNPYGAMAADILLNQLDILHAHPKLYVMPDDPRLGNFRPEFANMLGMLEENPATPKNKDKEHFTGADKIYRSHQMFRQLYKSHDNKVNAREFVRARVFDILVGDWGKHEDNWKWAGFQDTAGGWIFRPIPRDRDHVFSRWDGLFPYIADREWAKESGENFDYELTGIRSLMFQARHLDRLVASEMNKEDWIKAAEYIQKRITDDVIEDAVKNMPGETYPLSGKIIAEKLKSRVKDLNKYAAEYYLMLADNVDVVGSANDEYFDVTRNPDNSVTIKMYPASNGNPVKNKLLYNRTFYPEETNEIRLFGLDGKDVFVVNGQSDDTILLRLIGGPGRDSFEDQSKVNTFTKNTIIYENSKKASIQLGTEAWQDESAEDLAYDYDRTAFAYNTYIPIPFVSYNADDGFYFHLGYEIKTQSYGKKDYHILHNFGMEYATSGTISLEYQIRLHQIMGEWDLISHVRWAEPGEVYNIYGIGNNSVNDASRSSDYYKSRFSEKSFSMGLIHDFWKQSIFQILLGYENTKAKKNSNYIFDHPEIFGEEQLSILSGSANLDLDFRDNAKLPQNGMRLFARYENSYLLNYENKNFAKALSFIEHFSTVDIITPITLGLKAGAAGSYGKIPYYKLFSLGQEDFLRGYRKNRFLGEKMVFFNSDLRLHLLQWHSSFVPIRIGIKGFFDSGKIVDKNIYGGKWHNSWGAGFYIVPLEKDFTLNASFAFSDEESALFKIGIGTAFK